MFDVELLSRDLMRALRGERSQPAFSRGLGFRSNAAYLWEHGRRGIAEPHRARVWLIRLAMLYSFGDGDCLRPTVRGAPHRRGQRQAHRRHSEREPPGTCWERMTLAAVGGPLQAASIWAAASICSARRRRV